MDCSVQYEFFIIHTSSLKLKNRDISQAKYTRQLSVTAFQQKGMIYTENCIEFNNVRLENLN